MCRGLKAPDHDDHSEERDWASDDLNGLYCILSIRCGTACGRMQHARLSTTMHITTVHGATNAHTTKVAHDDDDVTS